MDSEALSACAAATSASATTMERSSVQDVAIVKHPTRPTMTKPPTLSEDEEKENNGPNS
jgi:hypothetical protein